MDVNRLLDFVRRRGGEVTPNEVARGMRAYRSDSLRARVDLDLLAVCGYGTWVDRRPSPRGGRPTRAFRLSGKVGGLSGKDRP